MKISTRMIAAFAATGLLAGGLGGAAVLNSADASQSGASLAAKAPIHTWKFVAIETGSHNVGKASFVGTDKDRKKGKTIGFDTISGKFNLQTHMVSIDFAMARRGGLLYGNVKGNGDTGQYAGTVTGGTGRFEGATGTATAHNAPHNNKKTFLTIKWTK